MNLSGNGGTGLALSSQARSKSEGLGACSRVIGSGISMKSLLKLMEKDITSGVQSIMRARC